MKPLQRPIKTAVAIIGAGPAGIATAIQLRRYKIPFLLFEKGEVGGLLKNASLLENYPTFPEGIESRELIALFKRHLERYSIEITPEEVLHLTRGLEENKGGKEGFNIHTPRGLYLSDFAVVATGTKARKYHLIEELAAPLKERTLYEPHSIKGVEEKVIGIIGGGDAAFDYALNLSKKNQIYLFNRTNWVKALPLLVDQVKMQPQIALWENTHIVKIDRAPQKALALSLERDGWLFTLEVDYLIGAIGREPQRDFFSPVLLDQEEELIHQGLLHLPGDIKNGLFRQVTISMGDGIRTAMEIWERWKEL